MVEGSVALVVCIIVLLFVPTSTTLLDDVESLAGPASDKFLKDRVKQMFYHAYDSYMLHAFPLDELKPMSCEGLDTWGSYSLTLIDALDTLVVLGNYSEFAKGVQWVIQNVQFEKDLNVSVFETNIRVLGGLLTSHLLAIDNDVSRSNEYMEYNGELLVLAEDLGRRLMKAFETPTGIPYGAVNLKYGIPRNETTITSVAGGGTYLIEFGVLSKLTGDPSFYQTAKRASKALWSKRSKLDLLGNHLDIRGGTWTVKEASIGSGSDSFYEYLLKGAALFGDPELQEIFDQAYTAIQIHLKRGFWYIEAEHTTGQVIWPLFNSLQGFWPGLQIMYGDVSSALDTLSSFHSIWRRFGFTPEGFNLLSAQVQIGQKGYPLRPELVESMYFAFLATRDPKWKSCAQDVIYSLETISKTTCGYATIRDVETHQLSTAEMPSYFLAETLKYLYLIYDEDNFLNTGQYIFSTEGHPFPLTYDKKEVTRHNQTLHCPLFTFEQQLLGGGKLK